jgi:hypothetical protein
VRDETIRHTTVFESASGSLRTATSVRNIPEEGTSYEYMSTVDPPDCEDRHDFLEDDDDDWTTFEHTITPAYHLSARNQIASTLKVWFRKLSWKFVMILDQINRLREFKLHRARMLDELLRLESPGTGTPHCFSCSVAQLPLYRCMDCQTISLYCSSCLLHWHMRHPLHIVEVSDLIGTDLNI